MKKPVRRNQTVDVRFPKRLFVVIHGEAEYAHPSASEDIPACLEDGQKVAVYELVEQRTARVTRTLE